MQNSHGKVEGPLHYEAIQTRVQMKELEAQSLVRIEGHHYWSEAQALLPELFLVKKQQSKLALCFAWILLLGGLFGMIQEPWAAILVIIGALGLRIGYSCGCCRNSVTRRARVCPHCGMHFKSF